MIFETPRLRVRKALRSDVEMYLALWNDPRVMTNVGFPLGLRLTRMEILEKIDAQPEGPFGCMLVAELRATDEVIGECKMYLPDEEGISETDVKLLPAYWGHRYGVEVKRGLIDYLFWLTTCTAVQATPNVNNIASIKMQQAVGGVRVGEGIFEFPESMRDHTVPVPHYIYHVYRHTWRAAKEA